LAQKLIFLLLRQSNATATLIKMFLYFYEAKMTLGFSPDVVNQIWLKESDNFNMENTNKDEENDLFSGWEKEETDDGTFHLVCMSKTNKKYYLSYFYAISNDEILLSMDDNNSMALKFVFDNDEKQTIICHKDTEKLHPMKIKNKIYLSCTYGAKESFYDKVCLTETSCLNSYVLK
jgi:hypothetical protein